MSMFRRRRTTAATGTDVQPDVPASTRSFQQVGTTPPPAPVTHASGAPVHAPVAHVPADTPVPARVERALIALTGKMQHCIERLDEIDHRLDELTETVANVPSHSDVLEVRLHSAKLAAELARATVELRGEIGIATEETRRTARAARAATETAVSLPVDVEIEKAEAANTETGDADENRARLKGTWTQSA
jgi:hypothetical protein